jgi:hypothetical protein
MVVFSPFKARVTPFNLPSVEILLSVSFKHWQINPHFSANRLPHSVFDQSKQAIMKAVSLLSLLSACYSVAKADVSSPYTITTTTPIVLTSSTELLSVYTVYSSVTETLITVINGTLSTCRIKSATRITHED